MKGYIAEPRTYFDLDTKAKLTEAPNKNFSYTWFEI